MLQKLRSHYRDVKTFGIQSLAVLFSPKGSSTRRHLTLPGGYRVSLRDETTDLDVVRQVFQAHEYDLARFKQYAGVQKRYQRIIDDGLTPVIIDAGANIGAASLYFANAFQKAHLIAVEPEPANAACCRENCAQVERITVCEAAIGATGGNIILENPSGHAWAPRTLRTDDGHGIRLVTIPDLVRSVSNGALFIVKIDIEGFESDLFAENLSWIDQTTAILVEIHDWMMPGKRTSRTLQRAMGARDFDLVISGENLIYFNDAEPT